MLKKSLYSNTMKKNKDLEPTYLNKENFTSSQQSTVNIEQLFRNQKISREMKKKEGKHTHTTTYTIKWNLLTT